MQHVDRRIVRAGLPRIRKAATFAVFQVFRHRVAGQPPEPAAIGRDLIAQRYFYRKVRDPWLADKFVRHSQPKEDDTTSPPAPAATRS